MTVEEAQKHNAVRMSDAQLERELYTVTQFSEQPPIRVAYIAVLRDEIARRVEDYANLVEASTFRGDRVRPT